MTYKKVRLLTNVLVTASSFKLTWLLRLNCNVNRNNITGDRLKSAQYILNLFVYSELRDTLAPVNTTPLFLYKVTDSYEEFDFGGGGLSLYVS